MTPSMSSAVEQPLLSRWLNAFSPDQIFCGIFSFFWLIYLWDSYVSWRQYKVYKTQVTMPSEVGELMEKETYEKSRVYQLDKSQFGLVRGLFSQVEFSLILAYELMPALWRLTGRHVECLGLPGQTSQSLLFITYSACFSFVIGLPWSYYHTFVIEERHGFNKQTLGFFVKDKVKGLAVSLAIGLPMATLLLWLIERGGEYFYVYAWAGTSFIMFVLICLYPSVIAPLFDRYEPLNDGELKTKIEALAARLKFPLKKLFVVEGSKRSAHSNAYLYGLWNSKRIVLFDTLIAGYKLPGAKDKSDETKGEKDEGKGEEAEKNEQEKTEEEKEQKEKRSKGCSNDEVVAVLGHELGHWSLGHNVSNIIISELNLFLMFFAFGQLMYSDSVFTAFGFEPPAPLLLRLVFIFEFVFSPYNELLSLALTALTRHFEFQADEFAVSLGYAEKLKTALAKLHTDNLSFPVYDWLYSAINHSHPPLLERLAAIEAGEAKRR